MKAQTAGTSREGEERQVPFPEERQLIAAMEGFAETADLPEFAEVEPGALLHLVKVAWRKAGRDGRRKHLTDQQVAEQIETLTKAPFSRNKYQAMFGEGRVLGDAKDYRQGVPREVAEAYLRVALTQWRKPDKESSTFLPLMLPATFDLDKAIANACAAMYGNGERSEVLCRPALGPSIQQFYREAGEAGQSVIVLARQQPITMKEPATQIPAWMELMQVLLLTIPAKNANALHVWAVEEPAVSLDTKHVAALTALARLQTVLMVARSNCAASGNRTLWETINARCPVAILRRDRPESAGRVDGAFIDQAAIFPDEPPPGWQARGIDDERINSLVTVSLTGRVTYSSYIARSPDDIPPVLELSSPATNADRAFRNLHLACLGAMGLEIPGGGGEVSPEEALSRAVDEGWAFIPPSNFIGQCFPLKEFE